MSKYVNKDLLEKVENLSINQQNILLELLNKRGGFKENSKEEVVVLSTLLRDIRNTSVYKNKNRDNSLEQYVYYKYLNAQEKELELEVYGSLQKLGIQLRKGGYDTPFNKINKEDSLNQEEKEVLDSIFPEQNLGGKPSQEIPLPDMTETELMFRDAQASAKYKSMRVEISEKDRTARLSIEHPPETAESLAELRAYIAELNSKLTSSQKETT